MDCGTPPEGWRVSDQHLSVYVAILKFHSYVLFNRQPSLHKMSMMSHRVRLMPYSSKLFSLF